MLKNYFKTSWRNLKANKFYSILNIGGLAVGLATGFMLLLWVQNELSYDKYNHLYKNIYQVNSHITLEEKSLAWQGAPAPLSIMAKQIPDVISVLRLGIILSKASPRQSFIVVQRSLTGTPV